ncbi:MAG: stage II sporulation protein M [Candidatus Pacearchaeota archaeon]|jgi:stage II sporulation protein M
MVNKKKRVKAKKDFDINSFFYDNFKSSLNTLKLTKKYFLFATILFFGSAFLGIIFPNLFSDKINDLIKNLVLQTEGLGPFELTGFIISNNIKSAFIGLLFGIFFGLVPMFIAVINGYVLGYVIVKVASKTSIFIVWRLVPHGIFEIPAILISLGIGIKLGLFLFLYRGKDYGKEFLKWLVDSIRVFIFIVIPLLVIAGLIEGAFIHFQDKPIQIMDIKGGDPIKVLYNVEEIQTMYCVAYISDGKSVYLKLPDKCLDQEDINNSINETLCDYQSHKSNIGENVMELYTLNDNNIEKNGFIEICCGKELITDKDLVPKENLLCSDRFRL